MALCLFLLGPNGLTAHEHEPITHTFEIGLPSDGPRLELKITDSSSDKPLAARRVVTP